MSPTVTISPKFQVVIPKAIRDQLRLVPGQKVEALVVDGRIELVLARGSGTPELGPHARLIRSPSRRGLVLLRSVVENDDRWDEIDELRRSARCETLSR